MNKDIIELEIDLDKKLTGVSNNEIAEYLVALECAISTAVEARQYTVMNILIGYKITVESKLTERLKKNLS